MGLGFVLGFGGMVWGFGVRFGVYVRFGLCVLRGLESKETKAQDMGCALEGLRKVLDTVMTPRCGVTHQICSFVFRSWGLGA